MGFRSTFTSQHYGHKLPDWFSEKYEKWVQVMDGTLIAPKTEHNIYDDKFFIDYQKALIEAGFFDEPRHDFKMVIAILHEDNKISKVHIFKDRIEYFWENDWYDMDFIWTQV